MTVSMATGDRGEASPESGPGELDPVSVRYNKDRIAHWEAVARWLAEKKGWGAVYQSRLAEVYRRAVDPGLRVLEVGSGTGDLLASVRPSEGVGVDLSPGMVALACSRHPELHILQGDAHALPTMAGPFQAILMSDVLNDVWDAQRVLEEALAVALPETRLVINFYSRLWEGPLRLAGRLGLAKPNLPQSWLDLHDVTNLLALAGWEVIRQWEEVLLPVRIPVLSALCNRILVRLWPMRLLALTHFVVARPAGATRQSSAERPVVSVVIPARNEAGNVAEIFDRTPEMEGGTELVFVEGHSTDGTFDAIEREMAARPGRRCRLFRQAGSGKGDAVRFGFQEASGDILLIMDADLTVAPEDLPRFVKALISGKGEFANGVRLVYPMEDQAMRFLNLLGNKFFSSAFTWLLGQAMKDSLCGTKCVWKRDYQRIAANRSVFGDFDPFGDFDLIFGANRLSLKIVDVPVRYRQRRYGMTNIHRWSHGWLLLRMVVFAARRIKFV